MFTTYNRNLTRLTQRSVESYLVLLLNDGHALETFRVFRPFVLHKLRDKHHEASSKIDRSRAICSYLQMVLIDLCDDF